MSNFFVCATDSFIIGGNENLIYRELGWAYEHGYKCILITSADGPFDNSWIEKFKKYRIEHYRYRRYWKFIHGEVSNNGKRLSFEDKDSVVWVSNRIELFLLSAIYQQKYKNVSFSKIFYVVHPFHTVFTHIGFLNYLAGKIWVDKIDQGSLVFMDDESKHYCESNYGRKYGSKIVRLGVTKEIYDNRNEKKDDLFNILTIGRLEFPFKAYVLGLIDAVDALKKEGYSLNLTIIGDGKDRKMLSDKINSLRMNTEGFINWVGTVEPENLKDYYFDADAYVGCGTTLIEASMYGVPSIAVYSYQQGDKCVGAFWKNPNYLGSIDGDPAPQSSLTDEIRRLIDATEEEYQTYCKKSQQAYEEMYSMEAHMNGLMDTKDTFLSNYDIGISECFVLLYSLMNKVRRVMHRRNLR